MVFTINEILDLCEFAGIVVNTKLSAHSDDPDMLKTEIQVVEYLHPLGDKCACYSEYPEEGWYYLNKERSNEKDDRS